VFITLHQGQHQTSKISKYITSTKRGTYWSATIDVQITFALPIPTVQACPICAHLIQRRGRGATSPVATSSFLAIRTGSRLLGKLRKLGSSHSAGVWIILLICNRIHRSRRSVVSGAIWSAGNTADRRELDISPDGARNRLLTERPIGEGGRRKGKGKASYARYSRE
jgi:hypothetical protein